MSQYNNGNAINHISVIPDYMDNKVEKSDEMRNEKQPTKIINQQ